MTTLKEKLEYKQYPWAYKAVNDGWEIVYIKDGRCCYFLEGGDDGVHSDENVVKYLVNMHNERL